MGTWSCELLLNRHVCLRDRQSRPSLLPGREIPYFLCQSNLIHEMKRKHLALALGTVLRHGQHCVHCSYYQVTKDVIKEFADDGVKYLELRSTPRGDGATGRVELLLRGCAVLWPWVLITQGSCFLPSLSSIHQWCLKWHLKNIRGGVSGPVPHIAGEWPTPEPQWCSWFISCS